MSVNPEARQLEVELLAYDGKTVLLEVAEEAVAELQKIKPGDGATIRVVEEGGKRIAKSFRIRAKDPNAAKADAMLLDMKDTHWLNRKYAAESLGELKDPRAVGPLVAALTDEVGDVRQRAYDSLIKLGGVSVTSLIPLLVAEEEELRQAVEDELSEAAASDQRRDRDQPDRGDGRDTDPGDDHGHRERDLHPPEHLPVREAHPARGVASVLGHALEAREDVPDQDEQRVRRERDHDGRVGEAGHRDEERDQGKARDRVEQRRDRGGWPAHDRGTPVEPPRARAISTHVAHRGALF